MEKNAKYKGRCMVDEGLEVDLKKRKKKIEQERKKAKAKQCLLLSSKWLPKYLKQTNLMSYVPI